MKRLLPLLGIALLAAAGCYAAGPSTTPSPTASPQVPVATPSPTASPTPPSPTSPAQATPSVPDVGGEVPQALIVEMMQQTADATGVNMAELRVVQASAVTWGDGSLGCPKPDVSYIQVLIDGYWVILEAGGERYDFRADGEGRWKLCDAGAGRSPLEEDY